MLPDEGLRICWRQSEGMEHVPTKQNNESYVRQRPSCVIVVEDSTFDMGDRKQLFGRVIPAVAVVVFIFLMVGISLALFYN